MIKIRTLLFLYVLNVFALACTHSDALKQNGELYTEYKNYAAAMLNTTQTYSSHQLEQLVNSHTSHKQADILYTSIGLPVLQSDLLLFPLEIKKELGHYESSSDNKGCLLINARSQQNKPIAVTVRYSKSNHWLIDDVRVDVLAPFNRFHSKAICDWQKLDTIRFREMI